MAFRSGAFGEIYSALNTSDDEEYAAKLEDASTKYPQLQFEAKLYNYLYQKNVTGFPNVYFFGQDQGYNIMIMDKLGNSLENLLIKSGGKFSLKTTLMLAEQMITRIEYIHSRNFLHRDIKPDNFLMGWQKQNIVYLIDLGLSKRYLDKQGKHIPYKEGKQLTGTARYASINTHLGIEQGRRDDLESLGYVLIYFLKGSLPWQGLQCTEKQDKYQKIMEKKINTPLEKLCKDLPAEFIVYLQYCKNLKFDEKPDYEHCKEMLRSVMRHYIFEYDFQWDWKKKNSTVFIPNNNEKIVQKQATTQQQDFLFNNIDNNVKKVSAEDEQVNKFLMKKYENNNNVKQKQQQQQQTQQQMVQSYHQIAQNDLNKNNNNFNNNLQNRNNLNRQSFGKIGSSILGNVPTVYNGPKIALSKPTK